MVAAYIGGVIGGGCGTATSASFTAPGGSIGSAGPVGMKSMGAAWRLGVSLPSLIHTVPGDVIPGVGRGVAPPSTLPIWWNSGSGFSGTTRSSTSSPDAGETGERKFTSPATSGSDGSFVTSMACRAASSFRVPGGVRDRGDTVEAIACSASS